MSAALEVALIAFLVSLGSIALSKKMVDQDRVEEIKARIKEYNKKYRKALKENDKQALKKLEAEGKEVTRMSMELMKYSFKPTMFTIIPILIVISAIRANYGNQVVASLPLIGGVDAFWWYVIVAMATSITLEIVYSAYRRRKKNGGTRKKD